MHAISLCHTLQGGGNRVSEDQIKEYLRYTLGEAPQPEWGLPNGWGTYLAGAMVGAACQPRMAHAAQTPRCSRDHSAVPSPLATASTLPPPPELFTWATGRAIDKDEAMACARRMPGRSWEACHDKLKAIGAHAPARASRLLSGGMHIAGAAVRCVIPQRMCRLVASLCCM